VTNSGPITGKAGFEMESIDLSFGEEALGAIARRAQDRDARPAVDHGEHSARHHVRPAEPGRRREVMISKQVVDGTARRCIFTQLRLDRRRKRLSMRPGWWCGPLQTRHPPQNEQL
jgi:hypothetical protein